jgi:hypothetical protein
LFSPKIAHAGVTNPPAGNYVGVSNRNVTMVGSPLAAKKGVYCHRSNVYNGGDLGSMNMTHYLKIGKTREHQYSCRYVILHGTRHI